MSVERLRNGRWRVRWRDETRVQRAKTFVEKDDALDFADDLRRGKAPDVRRDSLTFKDLTERWLAEHCDVAKALSSRADDRGRLAKHLLPVWGDRLAASLTKADAVTLRANLVAAGLSTKTANDIVGLARKILGDGVQWDLISANPLAGLAKLRQQEKPITYWLREERDRFLNYCRTEEPWLHDLVAVAVHTGLRLGELQGLCRDAVDLERRVITVRRIVCPRTRKLLEQTKSKRIREVPMNALVARVLESRRGLGALELVFGPPPRHSNYAVKALRRVAKRAGVRPIRFHDLRHTFASHMAMAGIDMQTLRVLLGHSDFAMTMRYAHLHPSHLKGVTDTLCVPPVYSKFERAGNEAR